MAKAFVPPLSGVPRRDRVIIRFKKQLATLQEIGDELGCSREWASVLVDEIAAKYGEEIFSPSETFWKISEVAKALEIDYRAILDLCNAGEIPYRLRGRRQKLLTQATVDTLKRHPRVTGERLCRVCRQPFILKAEQRRGTICSQVCYREYQRKRHRRLLAQKTTIDSLCGWRRTLWQRLRSHRLPKRESWLTLPEAAAMSSLSKLQVKWLYRRRIITTRGHPTRKWRGKPVVTYAASEMKIVRQVYLRACSKRHRK